MMRKDRRDYDGCSLQPGAVLVLPHHQGNMRSGAKLPGGPEAGQGGAGRYPGR
ncbi:MAG: hypothetical protein GX892_02430 [Thermoanaerobacteraceae bacterium]|nr:hypothetical protein [Thermoanaerobacteraceae bacterium]